MSSLVIWWILIISVHTKQSIIRVNNSPNNGINMLHNNESVTTSNNEWKVTFASQQGYDLLLKLDNEWGFDAADPSELTLTLNGTNYNSVEGDLLLVFSVSNIQYFGVVIRNEISNQLYKVYPEPFSVLSEIRNIQSSIISPTVPDRWDRITNNTNWYNTIPLYRNQGNIPLEWPIKITIRNDPTINTVTFSQIDFITNNELYSTTYLSSFITNNGIDIYIMSDGFGESFGIKQIQIEYQIQTIPTNEPTLEPTFYPTLYPIPSPTTYIPSLSPTLEPTLFPTTDAPSKSPTKVPDEMEMLTTTAVEMTNFDITNPIEAKNSDEINSNLLIVSMVTGFIGCVCCIFTVSLIFCCIQSRRYVFLHKHTRPTDNNNYHMPPMQIAIESNTNQLKYSIHQHNNTNRNSLENTSVTNDIDGSETCITSRSQSETNESKIEQKEGELITTDELSVAEAPTSDSERFPEKSMSDQQGYNDIVTGVNTDAINYNAINYNKMSSYLNDDEPSTSSEERILQQMHNQPLTNNNIQ